MQNLFYLNNNFKLSPRDNYKDFISPILFKDVTNYGCAVCGPHGESFPEATDREET